MTYNILWALTFYFFMFYITLVFSAILYTLPQVKTLSTFSLFKTLPQNKYIDGMYAHLLLVTFVMLMLFTNYIWVSPCINTWFGHIIFTSFQRKIIFIVLIFFYLSTLFLSTNFIFGPYEINDYYIVSINFYLWISFIFTANTLFSAIFFIEILSTLIFLLVTTSTFSTSYFYSNTTFSLSLYQNSFLAINYFNGLLFFFEFHSLLLLHFSSS